MSFIKNKFLFPLLVIVLAVVTIALLHSHLKNIDDSPEITFSPWALSSGKITKDKVSVGFPALGKVVSSSEVRIVPLVGGTILKMGPRAGGHVKKGELLVQIDTRTLQAQASALQAKLASANASLSHDRNELQREQHLLKEGGSSTSVVEQRQTKLQASIANVHALKKQLEALQVEISYGTIISPMNSQISSRLAEPGDAILPGKPVYKITASQGGRVIIPVPLSTLTRVAVGGKIILSTETQKIISTITRINPSLDSLSMGSLEVDLNQRPFNLPNGAPIAAKVITASETGMTVPVEALLPGSKGKVRKLFKVLSGNPSHIQQVKVQIILCGNSRCVIQGPINLGDKVITAHQSVLLQLHNGDSVITSEQAE